MKWRKVKKGKGWEIQVYDDGAWRKASDAEIRFIQEEQNRAQVKPDPRQQGPL
jgi:hypothetical protein